MFVRGTRYPLLKSPYRFDWTPASLGSAVKLWIDDTSHSGTDGTTIQTATDLTANANHPNQTVSTQRPVRRTGANGQNGLAVLEFDGTDDFYDLTTGLNITTFTITIVAKISSSSGSKGALFGGTGSFSAQAVYNGSLEVLLEAANAYNLASWTSATSWNVWGCYMFTFEMATKTGTIYFNSPTQKASKVETNAQFGGTSILKLMQGLNGTLGGKLGSVIICNTILSEADRTNMFTYNNNKWGLY